MWRRGRRTRTVLGILSLAYGVFSAVSLALSGRPRPIWEVVSVEGPLAWLVGPSLPWVALGNFGGAVGFVGLFAAGVGLLRTRARSVRIGLLALTLALVLSALFVPGEIALLSGLASLRLPGDQPAPPSVARVARELEIAMGSLGLAATVVLALYVLWVRREWLRMVAEG
jgi:hypothetical protein